MAKGPRTVKIDQKQQKVVAKMVKAAEIGFTKDGKKQQKSVRSGKKWG